MEAHELAPVSSSAPDTKRPGTWLVGVSFAALAICLVLSFVRGYACEEIIRTTAWSVVLLVAYAGWGTALASVAWTTRPSLPLRAVWGASLLTFVGGLLASASLLSRWMLLALVAIGVALFALDVFGRRESLAHGFRVRMRAARLHVPLTCLLLFVAALVVIHYLGGASDISSNPYDDDVSYYPFAKQLLERGTLIDPFSFRRMSTLGGQALAHAQLLISVPTFHLNVFDRSMCFLLAVGLIATHRVGGHKAPFWARLFAALFLIALPNTSINSASFYSGLAFFLAFYQTLDLVEAPAIESTLGTLLRLLPLALVGAAICTLRQNYQAQVALFLIVSYAFACPRRRILKEALLCFALVGVLVLPWLVLMFRSNATFLFPLMPGTINPDFAVTSQMLTPSHFVRFVGDVWLHSDPIDLLPLALVVALFIRERSPRRPLASQVIAGVISVLILCVSFSASDAFNLARYYYGFLTATLLLAWQVAASRMREQAPVAMLLGAIMVLTMAQNREKTFKMLDQRMADTAEMLRRRNPAQVEPPIAFAYHRMQDLTPAGARVLVMVDQPFYLDYKRNEIWNLDMPGTASPPPGIPCFQGPEPVAEYFRGLGIRYLMFVSPEHSTFQYRRDVWMDHVYDTFELWRLHAPYMVDVMDNVTELAKTRKHLHDEAGMTLLDLESRG